MAEIIGAVSAIIGSTDVLLKLTRELNDIIKRGRSAPKDIRLFTNEATTFTVILTSFYEVAKRAAGQQDEWTRVRRRLVRNVKVECETVKEDVESLVDEFSAIDPRLHSPARIFWTRVSWVFSRPDVESISLYMRSAKMSISFATNFFRLKDKEVRRDPRVA